MVKLDSCLRDKFDRGRLANIDLYAAEHAGLQKQIGVGKRGLNQEGTGGLLYRGLNSGDFARKLRIRICVRPSDACLSYLQLLQAAVGAVDVVGVIWRASGT